ncbi:nitrite reductase (NAD(P)H) small subunit [Limosilactobacillus sp. DJ3M12]|uniref:Rieske (2Fe-2S) protein n=1 Tax=Limosilactobacillus sp. DJ3M12 TaxID=2991835 RepID=UPI0024BAF8DE|nr:nitrite reductase (NAD(P)H) small subunit [Limosilactobacillus sp. DJ3M12]
MMSRTVFIRNLADLPKGMGFKVINGDETIDVIRTDDNQVLAIGNVCPGCGFPLSDGWVCGTDVVCAKRNERFNATTGVMTDGGINVDPQILDKHLRVPTYPVKVEDGKVYLTVKH